MPLTQTPTDCLEKEHPQQRSPLALVVICVGYFLVILDAMVVNVALPAIGHELHGGVAGLQWVVDAYTLSFAGLLLAGGALAERLGGRRVFLAGLVTFALASAACGLAPSLPVLIGARLVQGAGRRPAGPVVPGPAPGRLPDPRRPGHGRSASGVPSPASARPRAPSSAACW